MDVVLISLVVVTIVVLYYYLTRNYDHWEKRGIPTAKGIVPGLGHMLPVLLVKMNFNHLCQFIYEKYSTVSMVGFFNFGTPCLLVREPELVKTIMQTNFSAFHRNMFQIDPELDPLIAKNPFFMTGDEWMVGRKRLTYAFSSMRLKMLAETVQQVCQKLHEYVDRKMENGRAELELKDLFARFTGEVVAHAGFGIEGFCFEDKPQSYSFHEMGKRTFDPTQNSRFLQALIFFVPSLAKVLRVGFLPGQVSHFFRNLIKQILATRRQESAPRNDYFQLMVNLEKTEGKEIPDDVLAAHAVSFFTDGYETSSSTISFAMYQLAKHQDIQQKLREEILSVLAKHNGVINYDSLKEMTYMDQVISESQRLTPVFYALGKICTEKFDLKGSDGLSCKVEPGTIVLLPIEGLQRDARFWSDPETFDPDRFSEERKRDIEKFTFLPFGEGPRMCVGMRMGLLQAKAALAGFLSKYSLELSSRTKEPLQMNPEHFLALPIGGLWAHIKPL